MGDNTKYVLTIRIPKSWEKALFNASNQENESYNTIVKNALKEHLSNVYDIKVGRKNERVAV